ncbi:MAG: DNA (cytosine-5-)-methyltransferase [Ignavibacteriae bacterium HGW-Ignavibacteriae-3]|nr:MAG: DNA (cytosine-5-)-methyltransferase [Ignavibacteriae bacterium HGW-Ignavibacteriae-3]
MNKTINFVDLFAGASGLSEGFYRAGFFPIAHVEMDKFAAFTIKTRAAYYYCIENNIEYLYKEYYEGKINREEFYAEVPNYKFDTVINEEISDENFKEIIKRINESKQNKGKNDIDLIIGGPPCQAYSISGRRTNKSNKKDDKRIYYYKLYSKFLKTIRPKMFVFENVPGLISFENGYIFDDLRQTLSAAGYELDYKILNASSFGVLQDRKRIIIIGWKKEFGLAYPSLETTSLDAKINDLLKDLPIIGPDSVNPPIKYSVKATDYLKASEIRNGYKKVSQHITRPHNKLDLEIYKRAIELWNKSKIRIKYSDLPRSLRTHKYVDGFLDRFKVVAGNEPYCHTLVAHIAKDGHHYIHPDIDQCRSISVREAARIQSFPDNFIFEGPRTSAFTQIGNAVPPLMANIIAKGIKKELKSL